MQISTLNVHQNYKQEYRRGWQNIIFAICAILVSILFTYSVYGTSRHSISKYIVFLIGNCIFKAMIISILMSFITLMNHLFKRLESLNSRLRYDKVLNYSQFAKLIAIYFLSKQKLVFRDTPNIQRGRLPANKSRYS